ncbi:MAG TPA: saccharopine dehydrogenase C-terminal domain-containing protein [Candidatus Limnocylindrales bacterium]|nr:saccharopine dehydrogenase C-terminal domain-containing protein [Candidatus Limnocylindrales bacterium]
MKALILGLGGVGTVIAKTLSRSKKFEHVVLSDINEKYIRELAKELGPVFSAKVIDANNVNHLAQAFKDVDLVINAVVPEFNYNVLDAAVAAKIHYLDLASHGPVRLPNRITIQEEIEKYDQKFRDIDRSAFLCSGIDPGATNIFARYLADQMDEVDDVLVRDADLSTVEGFELVIGFSPDTAIEECLQPYLNYENGTFVQGEALTWSEEFAFPAPIGKLKVYSVSHEEAGTIPLYLGKPIKNCNFGYALPESFVNMLKVLRMVGLNSTNPIEVKGVKVIPRDVVTTLLPNPLELGGKMKGYLCVGTLVRGTKNGKKIAKFMYSMETHENAYKQMGVAGVSFQTGVPAAVIADLFADGLITRRGAFPAEVIDPIPFVERLPHYGLHINIEDYC